jgi:hypothetical protein
MFRVLPPQDGVVWRTEAGRDEEASVPRLLVAILLGTPFEIDVSIDTFYVRSTLFVCCGLFVKLLYVYTESLCDELL